MILMEKRSLNVYNMVKGHTLMNFNLYPYNLWILYASLVLLVINLILLLKHALPLLSALKGIKPDLDHIQNNVGSASAKASAFGTKAAKDLKKITDLIPVILLALAIKKDYDQAEGSGIRQIERSAVNVYRKRSDEKKMVNKIAQAVSAKK